MYTVIWCTPDNAIRFTMCKHIHLVCTRFPPSSIDASSIDQLECDSNNLLIAGIDCPRQNEIDKANAGFLGTILLKTMIHSREFRDRKLVVVKC